MWPMQRVQLLHRCLASHSAPPHNRVLDMWPPHCTALHCTPADNGFEFLLHAVVCCSVFLTATALVRPAGRAHMDSTALPGLPQAAALPPWANAYPVL